MILLIVLFTVLVFLLFMERYGNRFYREIGLVALIGHILVTVFLVPRLPYSWDIGQFHQIALSIHEGILPTDATGVLAFGTYQALVYAMFPVSTPTTVGIINGLLAVLIPIPAVYTARRLHGEYLTSAKGVIVAVLFLPLPFYLMSLPMRDTLAALMFFTGLALVVHMLAQDDFFTGFVFLSLVFTLYPLRQELSLVLGVSAMAGFAVKLAEYSDVRTSVSVLAVILSSIGALGFSLLAELLFSIEGMNRQLSGRTRGGAVYLEGFEYSSWFDVLLAAPARALYFQFTPFPLHVDSLFHVVTFIEMPIIIVLFLAAARSMYQCDVDTTVGVIVVTAYVSGAIGYGLIDGNFGTVVRHRIVFEFILIVMAAPVLQRWEVLLRDWLGVVPSQSG